MSAWLFRGGESYFRLRDFAEFCRRTGKPFQFWATQHRARMTPGDHAILGLFKDGCPAGTGGVFAIGSIKRIYKHRQDDGDIDVPFFRDLERRDTSRPVAAIVVRTVLSGESYIPLTELEARSAFQNGWRGSGRHSVWSLTNEQAKAIRDIAESAYDTRVKALRDTPTARLEELNRSAGHARRETSGSTFVRNPIVIELRRRRADYCCEQPGCNWKGFAPDGSDPFVEVHHIHPLAEGGPDTLHNTAALCPNCHRAAHYAVDRSDRRRALEALRRRVP